MGQHVDHVATKSVILAAAAHVETGSAVVSDGNVNDVAVVAFVVGHY